MLLTAACLYDHRLASAEVPTLSPASVRRSIQKGAVPNEEWRPVQRWWTSNERKETGLAESCSRELRGRYDGRHQKRRLEADLLGARGGRLLALRKQRAAAFIGALDLKRRLLVLRLMAAAGRADGPLHIAEVKSSPAEAGGGDHGRYEKACEASMNHQPPQGSSPRDVPQGRRTGPRKRDRTTPRANHD